MLDLETLAVTPRSTILTLGAVQFDPFGRGILNQLYMRLDLDAQDDLGREVDPDTIDWWGKQDPQIMEEAFNPDNRVSLSEAVARFHKFAWGCEAFWSHGATFDLVIIEDLYKQLGKGVPWNYWQIRCSRTLFNIGIDGKMPQGNKHNALDDAIRQAIGVQNIFRELRIVSK